MKNIKYILWVLVVVLFFNGCFNKQLTDCDHPTGWCNETRKLSIHSWKYAQLSKNVYKKEFQYNAKKFFKELNFYENKKLDFYAILYKDKINGSLILVFRGTDSVKDMVTGNNPFKPNSKQNQYALKIYDEIESKFGKINAVAGHSLGGGIAMHISLNRDNVIAYSFNGSPIFRNKNHKENTRYSIVEYGEILKLARFFGREATQLYTSIGCSDMENPISQHDMRKLADCLTQIASIDSLEANESLNINKINNKFSNNNKGRGN